MATEQLLERHDWEGLRERLQVDKSLLSWRDNFGQSIVGRIARHSAAHELLRELLAKGADPNLMDRTGVSPLGAAIDGCHSRDEGALENALALIGAGADLRAPVANEYPPLHWAVHEGKASFVRILLDAGADPFAMGPYGQNAFEIADEFQIAAIIELLSTHQTNPTVLTESASTKDRVK